MTEEQVEFQNSKRFILCGQSS